MNRERWSEIKLLLDEVLDVPLGERAKRIEHRCGSDEELRRELETYLALEHMVEPLFEEPVIDLIAGLPPEYRAGQCIGSYELEEEIARGGMGVVYRARRVEGGFDQTVAIKVLKRGFDTGDFVRRFRTEQQVLARLDHRNIARLLDGGATPDGLPYLVMELVDGIRLDDYCASDRPNLAERLEIFSKLCHAVHAAHQHMVVHCDLKPSNILITSKGEPMLLDFGIAKVLRSDAETTASLSLRLGTPPYASPEQAAGQDITTGSDVYGLGGILHFLLIGLPPGSTGEADEPRRLARMLANRPPDQRPVNPAEVRGDLEAIFTKATAQDPGRRYSSAAALAEDIARHQASEPIAARAQSWLGVIGLFVRRHQRQVVFAGVIVLLLGAGLGLAIQSRLAEARAAEIRSAYLEMIELLDPTRDESADDAARTAIEKVAARDPFSHPADRALFYDRIGRYFLRQRDYEQADKHLGRALNLRLGDPKIPACDVAASFNNLGLLRHAQRRLGEAATLYRCGFESYEEGDSETQAEALDLVHNLAGVERDLGHFDRAEALYRDALKRRTEYFGKESREAARTAMNFGTFLLRQNRIDEAAPLLEQAAASRYDYYGEGHHRLASSWINLAVLREAQGRANASIELYRRALAIRSETAGNNSQATAQAQSALGFALLGRATQSDLEEARKLLESAVRILEERSVPSRENLLVAKRNLGAVLLELDELEVAERLLREVEAHAAGRPPASQWRVADARSLLGGVLVARGQYEEGIDWLEGTCELLVEAKGAESRYARRACERWNSALGLEQEVGRKARRRMGL